MLLIDLLTQVSFFIATGWEIDENPVGEGFEIFWMIFEPILFGLTGTVVKVCIPDTPENICLGADESTFFCRFSD